MAVQVEEISDAVAEEPGENPLVPHEKLRSIYLGMRDGRLLERELGRGKRRAHRSETPRAEEACRASTLLALRAGDLVCAPVPTPAMQLLLGRDPTSIRDPTAIVSHLRSRAPAKAPADKTPHWLAVEDGTDRLRLAAGAAMALKAQTKSRALLVYLRADEASAAVWRSVLELAAKAALPMLFVALPGTPDAKPSRLSGVSEKLGVPGIAVDAYDCVGIYRVASEALLRARTGSGPVLVEAISVFPGAPRRRLPDPVALLEQSLLARNVVTPAWLRDTRATFLKRLTRAASGKATPRRKQAPLPSPVYTD